MLKHAVFALALAASLPSVALADVLSATQSVERVVTTTDADGNVSVDFQEAATVVPGETLAYWLSYDNGADAAADSVVLTVPVPENVTYIEDSVSRSAAPPAFSADGGVTFVPRDELKVSIDGVERQALSEEITHIRWAFAEPIAPGETGRLGFQAVLN